MRLNARALLVVMLNLLICETLADTITIKRDDLVEISISNKKKLTYETLREQTLLKAARITQERGFTHFEFVYADQLPISGSIERRGNMVMDIYGNASITEAPSHLMPSPLRDGGAILIQLCNAFNSRCRGLQAKDIIKNIHN